RSSPAAYNHSIRHFGAFDSRYCDHARVTPDLRHFPEPYAPGLTPFHRPVPDENQLRLFAKPTGGHHRKTIAAGPILCTRDLDGQIISIAVLVDSIEFYLDCPRIDRGIVVVAVDPCNVSVSIDIRRGTSAELMECFQDVDQAVSGVVIRPDRSDIEGRLFEADFHLFWLEVRRCAEQEGHGARCVRRGRRR